MSTQPDRYQSMVDDVYALLAKYPDGVFLIAATVPGATMLHTSVQGPLSILARAHAFLESDIYSESDLSDSKAAQ